jgi:hypothetical protein
MEHDIMTYTTNICLNLVMSYLQAMIKKASQLEHRNNSDFNAISQVSHEFDNHGIFDHNFGIGSGCIQLHKYFHYVSDDFNPIAFAMKRNIDLPFKYFSEK